ncbi:hypothetical protein CVT25_003641 [Psilocybe cyanescens]|uniref:DUF202 domain-containing protein n=1 Tax=Psilocybe cyanescens TaxID=93625 RepID=A0A409WPC2_PSICY|nr:hypothetical protein CVT25_003641 [Psilocybe cyanescens]
MEDTEPRRRTYRGHRRNSFEASDVNELVEIRARQRTFHGAYSRTALGVLGYSLTILRFWTTLCHLGWTFIHRHKEAHSVDQCIRTKGQEGTRIFGRPFVTAGWIVLQVTFIVAAVEIALLFLILRHHINA